MTRIDPVEVLQDLIRFDTTNPPGREQPCIAYLERLLAAIGLETQIAARDAARPNLVARLPGHGQAPPLLLHGHVDVVTAEGGRWSHPPFAGEIADGCVWGRGALDMKGGVAMFVDVAAHGARSGGFEGDLLLAILADEEAGSSYGARFLVEERRDLFQGIRYALGEGGGFVVEIGGHRFYPVKVMEKRYAHLRATIRGEGGHGSIPVRGGAMAGLGRMLATLDRTSLPVHLTPVAIEMLTAVGRETGLADELLDPRRVDAALRTLGPAAAPFEAAVRHTVTPTIVRGGHMLNVIPSEVSVDLDARILPGFSPADLLTELTEVIDSDVELTFEELQPEPPAVPDGTLTDVLFEAARRADPAAIPIPMLDPAVTDARLFAQLGIQTYGFLPMPTPPGFGRRRLVHGVDERIPVQTVRQGAAVLRWAVAEIFRLLARRGNGATDRAPMGAQTDAGSSPS